MVSTVVTKYFCRIYHLYLFGNINLYTNVTPSRKGPNDFKCYILKDYSIKNIQILDNNSTHG